MVHAGVVGPVQHDEHLAVKAYDEPGAVDLRERVPTMRSKCSADWAKR